MFTYELALAAVLVASPAEPLPETGLQAWFQPLHASVRRAAIGFEILDVRETHCTPTQEMVFALDLRSLQARFQDLDDAPTLAECSRFPGRDVATDYLAFNRAYRQDLANQLLIALVHSENLRQSLAEADYLYRVWETVRNAQSPCYYVMVRRQDLRSLRNLIGAEAFYSGQLPPHVPTWRFPVQRTN